MLNFLADYSFSAKALDEYASIKTRASKATEEEENIDPRLEAIVERMLEKYDICLVPSICRMGYESNINSLTQVYS